jgi:5S rRNA maturation endonuclease (ribonuclease M5)
MITIHGRKVSVDVLAELEEYSWTRPKWNHDKLIAGSPFRYDSTPSFFVNLDESHEFYGCWSDSGAVDDEWKSGGFVKLIAFLRDETYFEAAEYLLDTYGVNYGELSDGDSLPPLKIPKLTYGKVERFRQALDPSVLEPYKFRHPYLARRGISEAVQRLMNVGYDRDRKAVTIPWYLPDGRLANVKYRRVDSKIFWYRKNSCPIRNLVYGINVIYRKNISKTVICEAEIDAMTVMTSGYAAIAVGGSSLTDQQAGIIKRSPIEQLYIATDNDEVGERLRAEVIRKLSGYVTMYDVRIPVPYKDANEVGDSEVLRKSIEKSEKVREFSII